MQIGRTADLVKAFARILATNRDQNVTTITAI
jgi:hypothetical protein